MVCRGERWRRRHSTLEAKQVWARFIGHPIGYGANQCAPPPRATGDALMSWERQRFQDTISSQIRAESYEPSRANGEG